MRVKIGDEWHDGSKEPVAVELDTKDLASLLSRMLADLPAGSRKYAVFPEGWGSAEKMKVWAFSRKRSTNKDVR